MRLNLTRDEKDFLYVKHRREGDNEISARKKIDLVDREIKSVKEMKKIREIINRINQRYI